MKKNKSRNNGNNNNASINSVNYRFDSVCSAGKFCGTAWDLIKRYNDLAKDAQRNGDYVEMEVFHQYAEHYRKVLTEINERRAQQAAEAAAAAEQAAQEAADAEESEEPDVEEKTPEEIEEEKRIAHERAKQEKAERRAIRQQKKAERQARRMARKEAERAAAENCDTDGNAGETENNTPSDDVSEPEKVTIVAAPKAEEQPKKAIVVTTIKRRRTIAMPSAETAPAEDAPTVADAAEN